MSDDAKSTYEQLCDHARETALLTSIEELLGWDERVGLPRAAGEYRAEQITYLAGMAHRRQTDPRLGDWLGELTDSPLAADPHSDAGATIRQLRRNYEKKIKLPQSLVEELARTAVLGQQAWTLARENDDFARFQPLLERTIALKQQEADAIGYPESRYDALLDDYEPGELTSSISRVLADLRDQLVPLVAAVGQSDRQAKVEILARSFPIDSQESFGREIAAQIGFDFDRGRLDVTHHPFCAGMGPSDTRITTRYQEHHFGSALFGILHEAGHGIYEQGLRTEMYGLPSGEAVSLGIHESQSRLWENLVGRSRPFWEHFYIDAQRAFSQALGDVPFDDFFFAVNDVRPSLVRVEADEATYNLHILIRFELEQDLLTGDLSVVDLRGAWNEKYRQYLGIEPPSDADGVLQDVHWSAGLIGYFPTYTLGNLYASQLFEAADAELGGLADHFRHGQFGPLREWLTEKVHRHGQCYSAAELVERATGQPLSHDALMRHLHGKLGPLYGLD